MEKKWTFTEALSFHPFSVNKGGKFLMWLILAQTSHTKLVICSVTMVTLKQVSNRDVVFKCTHVPYPKCKMSCLVSAVSGLVYHHCSGHKEQLRKCQGTFISDPYPLSPFFASSFYNFPSVVILPETSHPVSLLPMSSCFWPSLPSSLHFLYPDLCPLCRSAWHFNHHILRLWISKPHPSQLAVRVERFNICDSAVLDAVIECLSRGFAWACLRTLSGPRGSEMHLISKTEREIF